MPLVYGAIYEKERLIVVLELLSNYRYIIWLVGGISAFWLLFQLSASSRVARYGVRVAQRDYAAWRVRNATIALGIVIPLLIVTTVVSVN